MPLEIANHEITAQHHELVGLCLGKLKKWRAFIIGVDGWTHSGKSTLGRALAWQLDMPCIETDLFFTGKGWGQYHFKELRRIIRSRLDSNRPVIVEGVSLLRTLSEVCLEPDFLIYTKNTCRDVSETDEDKNWMKTYERKFQPCNAADFKFDWKEPQ